MSNKKGFTLIEIIAVVIIIGIIALIAIPSVSSYINNTRNTTYKAHEKTMEEAAQALTIEVINGKDSFALPKRGDHAEVFLNELVDKEYLDSLKDPNTGELCNESMSYVIIKNIGSSNYDYKSCLYCGSYITDNDECSSPSIEDNEKPVCGIITGESSEWTNKSRTITVACSDAGSGCIRNKFTKTFNTTANTGIIQISDKAGKTNECNVNVRVDKTEPTCELIIEGDGNVESTGWSSGRTVVVKYKNGSRKDEHSGIATYGIGTSLKNRSYNKQESYAIENISGTTTVIGYVKDNAGNEGTCYKTVSTGVERPKFDIRYGFQVYPLKDRFTLTDAEQINNSKIKTKSTTPYIEFNHMAKYQNVTALIMEFTSAISDPSSFKLIVGGNIYVAAHDNASGNRLRFFIETEPGLNSVTNDTYKIQLGNKNNVTYDISRIEIEQKQGNSISKYNVAVNLMTRKAVVKTTKWSWDNGSSWDNKYYKLIDPTATAKTGNARVKNDIPLTSDPVQYSIVKGDRTEPTVTLTSNNTNWTNQNIKITASVTDSESGTIGWAWSTASSINYYSGPWEYYDTAKTTANTHDYVATSNGTYYFYAKDDAGNVKKSSITITNIDLSPPTCTHDGDSKTYATSRTIKYGCKDNNGQSNCDPNYSGGSKTFTSTTITATIPSYVIKDNAGNETTCPQRTADVYVDTTAPSCTHDGDSTTYATSRTIYYGCKDDNSGCDPNNSGGNTKFTSTTVTSKIASYVIKDKLGNSTTCPARTANVYVDKTGPSCTFGTAPTIDVGDTKTIELTCTDGNSGVKNQDLSADSFTLSNNNVSIKGVTKSSVTNGYKYTISLLGSNNGTTSITLKSGKVVDNVSNGSNTPSATITGRKTYTLSFNGNGGTGSVSSLSCKVTTQASCNVTLPNNGFSKTGHTFNSWGTTSGATSGTAPGTAIALTGNATRYAVWTANLYYIDLNGWLDGALTPNLSGFGTCDVTINGNKVANDVTDYYAQHPYGSTWSFSDCKGAAGHTYNGIHSGALSGTLGAGAQSTALDFSTNDYTIDINLNLPDGSQPWQTCGAGKFNISYNGGQTIYYGDCNERFSRLKYGSTIIINGFALASGLELNGGTGATWDGTSFVYTVTGNNVININTKYSYVWKNSCTNYNHDCTHDCSPSVCMDSCKNRYGKTPIEVKCANQNGPYDASNHPWNGYCWCKYSSGTQLNNYTCNTSSHTVHDCSGGGGGGGGGDSGGGNGSCCPECSGSWNAIYGQCYSSAIGGLLFQECSGFYFNGICYMGNCGRAHC